MFKKSFLIIFGLLIFSSITFAQTIPVPTGWDSYTYDPIVDPIISTEPSEAQPIGVGSIAGGGDMLSLHVGLSQLSGAVDVYFAIYAPNIDPDSIYILTSDSNLLPATTAFESWKGNTTGPIDEYLFDNIPIFSLPSGTYYLYLAVTPAYSTNTFYIWTTYFTVLSFPVGAVTYQLTSGSTYYEGCVSPCMCPVKIGGEIQGSFDLVETSADQLFKYYDVERINWVVVNASGQVVHTINGKGSYKVGGEFALTHEMLLTLGMDGQTPPAVFSSGFVPGGGEFPAISITVDKGTACYDVWMDIVAKPVR